MRRLGPAVPFALALSCQPTTAETTGGVELSETIGKNGQSCGRGLAVALTDYVSTNIAILNFDGVTESGSFIHSGAASVKLNAPLSGDVVFPHSRMQDDVVLIDRYPASVLTFVDPKTAKVRDQLEVRTGFDANPQDYLVWDDETALVSRYETNARPGREDFDEGDDLLVVDRRRGEAIDRIGLSEAVAEGQHARPGTMVRLGELVAVSLSGLDAEFEEAFEGRFVLVDTAKREIVDRVAIEGLRGCGGMALSPQKELLAVSCSGLLRSSNEATPKWSGVVIYRLESSDERPRVSEELIRFEAKEVGFGPFTSGLSFASEELVLATTYGALEGEDAGRADRLLALSVDGTLTTLWESSKEPFTLGSVRCLPACEVCFLADAGRKTVARFAVRGDEIRKPSLHPVDTDIALPPRLLGWF